MDASGEAYPGMWVEKKFIVGEDVDVPNGSDVAMIAFHFANAQDLDMRFGEFSIKRPTALKTNVDAPVIESSKLLSARHDGVDGKIIFNMPNDKGSDVCYNSDVNASLFKLYYQQKHGQEILMGVTTSWAGLLFSAPNDMRYGNEARLGVSAVALDQETESEISWGEWQSIDEVYNISDEISISKSVIKPNETFSIYYNDLTHEDADWTLINSEGKVVAELESSKKLVLYNGISDPGTYDLIVKGYEAAESGREASTRVLKGFVQITGEGSGAIPYFTSVDVPESKRLEIDGSKYWTEFVVSSTQPKIEYTIDPGSAQMSRGVRVGDNGLGFRYRDTGLNANESFAVSFWFKPESFKDKSVHALNIRYKGDPWSVNHWGWMWHTLTEDGHSDAFTIRMKSGKDASYRFDNMKLYPGAWYHMAYSFEFDENGGVKPSLFINGERQEITSWKLGDNEQEGEVDFSGPVGAWKENNVVALGGYLHKTGSVRGNVDNFMVWNKALSDEDVAFAMSDVTKDRLKEGVVGYFDFESEPNEEGLFENKGSSDFKAGIHGYKDTEVEGQGTLEWRNPEYCTGCPFTTGEAFSLTPIVECKTPGAYIIERDDNGTTGYVRLQYPEPANPMDRHYVDLSVENEYGISEFGFSIALNEIDAVSTIGADSRLEVCPKIFDSEISVSLPESGNIRLSLYSIDGRCMLSNAFHATAGDTLKIFPDVPSGPYILRVERESSLIGVAKLLR